MNDGEGNILKAFLTIFSIEIPMDARPRSRQAAVFELAMTNSESSPLMSCVSQYLHLKTSTQTETV